MIQNRREPLEMQGSTMHIYTTQKLRINGPSEDVQPIKNRT